MKKERDSSWGLILEHVVPWFLQTNWRCIWKNEKCEQWAFESVQFLCFAIYGTDLSCFLKHFVTYLKIHVFKDWSTVAIFNPELIIFNPEMGYSMTVFLCAAGGQAALEGKEKRGLGEK